MQLSAHDAINEGFITLADGTLPKSTKNSSVDLRIGVILRKEKDGTATEAGPVYTIKPQETVFLISAEDIHIKEQHIAYVFLKNHLSRQGILAINTGIIDEGYQGHISTLATNLSKYPFELNIGDEFFRVVIQRFENKSPALPITRTPITKEQYLDYRKHDLSRFPDSFLDREKLKREINEELRTATLDMSVKNLTIAISIIGILLAMFTVFAPLLQSHFAIPSGSETRNALRSINSIEFTQQSLGQKINENVQTVTDTRQVLGHVRRETDDNKSRLTILEQRLRDLETGAQMPSQATQP